MALTRKRMRLPERWSYHTFTLTAGTKAFQGGIAAIALTTGKVVPGTVSTTLFPIGYFAEDVDASLADKSVTVELFRELHLEWFKNSAGGNAVAATDLGGLCYLVDDETVTITSTGASVAGRIWGVDAAKGVLIEILEGQQLVADTGEIAGSGITPGSAYQVIRTNAAGDSSEWGRPHGLAAEIVFVAGAATVLAAEGSFRYIDSTAANSSVTVGTSGAEAGDAIDIGRDTAGAHTVAIVDGGAGTPTLMTMTASKKAGCRVAFDGTNWRLVASYQEP